MESDGLILVAIVANDRLSQHVEGSTKENVVGGFANDVHLQIQRQVANLEWDVASQAQRLVDVAIRALHVKDDSRVVSKAKLVTNCLRHRDYLRSWVDDAFDDLFRVDDRM